MKITEQDYKHCKNTYNLTKDIEEWEKENRGVKYIIEGKKHLI